MSAHVLSKHQRLREDLRAQAAAADGTDVGFPPPQGTFQAALLCIAFRAGAEVGPASPA